MTAVELVPPGEAVHGNDRWYEVRRAGVTASEIAIVLGISPYGSPFSLYWQKVHDWRDDGNEFTSAGRHLEDAIASWWGDQEVAQWPDWALRPAGLFANVERPWQLATPDRLIHAPCENCGGTGFDSTRHFEDQPSEVHPCGYCGGRGDGELLALLECKWVAYSWDGWGEPGTDEIPVYYRAQALWQLDVLGVDEVHFAVLGPGGFRAYGPIRRDEADLEVMRAAGAAFHARLASGDAPDLDGHSATITALRKLHPSVGEGDVEVPIELAESYAYARAAKKQAEELIAQCEAEIRAALGSEFNRAVAGPKKKLVASRSVYDQSGDSAELTALEDDWPVVDRLNPGRSASYA